MRKAELLQYIKKDLNKELKYTIKIMENKEQLINHIREWVKIDEEIKTLNAELRTRREKKRN